MRCDLLRIAMDGIRGQTPIPLFSGLTPISEFRYAVFTRRGVAFRGMAVNPENIPGHPGSARRFQAGRCKRDLGYRTGAEMSRTHPRRFFRHGLLPQLLVFEAVARLGSVTRAAGELHLAQPTVSLQLKKLAATLEVTLFEQQGRSLRLTGAGHGPPPRGRVDLADRGRLGIGPHDHGVRDLDDLV